MTKNEFIKIGEQIIAKPKGADYDLIPGKVYDLSWNRWEDSPIFKENGELNLPKKVYSTKTDDIFKKRIITYFNKANTNTTGVMLAGTKGTGNSIIRFLFQNLLSWEGLVLQYVIFCIKIVLYIQKENTNYINNIAVHIRNYMNYQRAKSVKAVMLIPSKLQIFRKDLQLRNAQELNKYNIPKSVLHLNYFQKDENVR